MDSLGSVGNYTQPIPIEPFDLNEDLSNIIKQIADSITIDESLLTLPVEKTMELTLLAIEITKLYNQLELKGI
jgi:hypothetical protein